jgi:hypothetical protein
VNAPTAKSPGSVGARGSRWPRVVAPEVLDGLAADDPSARRSRRDLARVHRFMRTRSIVVQALRALVSGTRGGAALQVLELGAGDGTLMLGVARSLAPAWPPVELTLLDRLDLVTPATLAAYAELGWTARVRTGDALRWAADAAAAAGTAAPRWQLVVAHLFLHHFEGAQLEQLLRAISVDAERFLACEPRRGALALAGSHLIGALGVNAVTRGDAVLSVHAGFRGHELGALWPASAPGWRLQERDAGLFSHCLLGWRGAAA